MSTEFPSDLTELTKSWLDLISGNRLAPLLALAFAMGIILENVSSFIFACLTKERKPDIGSAAAEALAKISRPDAKPPAPTLCDIADHKRVFRRAYHELPTGVFPRMFEVYQARLAFLRSLACVALRDLGSFLNLE